MAHSLPTISRNPVTTREDLVRFYHRAELHWARHLGEEAALDVGTALLNPQLRSLEQANRIFDAALPEGVTAAQAFEQVQAHFANAGCVCRAWVMNPSVPADGVQPLVEHLLSTGYVKRSREILYLQGLTVGQLRETQGLTIIPARASFRHARQLAEQRTPDDAAAVNAALMHLDDPHVDSLLALRDGSALGQVTVLSVGEIGAITELFVSAANRRQGIGRTLLSRAMEIAARSLFKHVFTSTEADNTPAQTLFRSAGFTPIGEMGEMVNSE